MARTRKRSEKPKEPPRYEDIRSRLEQVVSRLERGEGPLEENLTLYEEGVALVRSAHEMLDKAEKRLEILKPQADGSFRLEDGTAEFASRTGASAGDAEGGPGEEDGE